MPRPLRDPAIVVIVGLLVRCLGFDPGSKPKIYAIPGAFIDDMRHREACYLSLTTSTTIFAEKGKGQDHLVAEAWFNRAALGGHGGLTRVDTPAEADILYVPVLPFMSFRVSEYLKTNKMGRPAACENMVSHQKMMSSVTESIISVAEGLDAPPLVLVVVGAWGSLGSLSSLANATKAHVVIANQEYFISSWCGRRFAGMPYAASSDLTTLKDYSQLLQRLGGRGGGGESSGRNISIFSMGQLSHGLPDVTTGKMHGGQRIRLAHATWATLPGAVVRFTDGSSKMKPLNPINVRMANTRWNVTRETLGKLAVSRLDGGGYAALVRRSVFCVVPAGDTATTRKLYDALAGGCVPVILSDRLWNDPALVRVQRDGFQVGGRAILEHFAVVVNETALIEDPQREGEKLLAIPPERIAELQRAGAQVARNHLIYGWGDPDSTRKDAVFGRAAGSLVSMLVEHCAPGADRPVLCSKSARGDCSGKKKKRFRKKMGDKMGMGGKMRKNMAPWFAAETAKARSQSGKVHIYSPTI